MALYISADMRGGGCSSRAHVLCYDLVPQVNSSAINQLVQQYHRVPV